MSDEGSHAFDPRQERSRRNREGLLIAGHGLLMTSNFNTLRVETICEAANVTVGAFYRRFASKEVYFLALQSRVILDGLSRIAQFPEKWNAVTRPFDDKLPMYHDIAIGWMRENEGVLGAALQRLMNAPDAVTPFVQVRQMDSLFLEVVAQEYLLTQRKQTRKAVVAA
jgi:AcrR family transcriptional regulator